MVARKIFWYFFLCVYLSASMLLSIKRSGEDLELKFMAIMVIVSIGSLLTIYQFTFKKTMIFAGFDLPIDKVFLRLFFFMVALIMCASVIYLLGFY